MWLFTEPPVKQLKYFLKNFKDRFKNVLKTLPT